MDLDKMLAETIDLARSAKIPVSKKIDRHIYINTRRKTILGTCERQKNGEFRIVISSFVISSGEDEVRNVIAHEILHTCYKCANHGKLWKAYADRLGRAMGQKIERTGSCSEAESIKQNAPYILVCQNCGREFYRFRKSRLVTCPEKYRCVCGGKICLINS